MTGRQPFSMNPSYQRVIRALLDMHRLTAMGMFESPEAEAIRDAMDAPWEGLSDVERKRIRGLSEDLNAISEITSAQALLPMEPQAQAKLNEVSEARQRGEWDRALEVLRRCGKHVPPALASYLRGTIWRDAGDPATAAAFFEDASRLEPDNGNYVASLLDVQRKPDLAVVATRGAWLTPDQGNS